MTLQARQRRQPVVPRTRPTYAGGNYGRADGIVALGWHGCRRPKCDSGGLSRPGSRRVVHIAYLSFAVHDNAYDTAMLAAANASAQG